MDKRVASLHIRVGGKTLTVVCTYAQNGSSEYAALMEVLAGVLWGTPWSYWETSTRTSAMTETPGGA